MSWQEEYTKKYSERLAERWTVEGKLIPDPSNMYVMVTPSGRQASEPFDITKTIHIPLTLNPNERVGDLHQVRVEHTREICGND